MSRPLRIEFAGGLYHVTSRGDGREAIFLGEEDRRLFLGVLSEVVPDFNWACILVSSLNQPVRKGEDQLVGCTAESNKAVVSVEGGGLVVLGVYHERKNRHF